MLRHSSIAQYNFDAAFVFSLLSGQLANIRRPVSAVAPGSERHEQAEIARPQNEESSLSI
jgi:hypothetical protein